MRLLKPSAIALLATAWASSVGCSIHSPGDELVGLCLLSASPANVFLHRLDGGESIWLVDSREIDGVIFHRYPQLVDQRTVLLGREGLPPSVPRFLQVLDLVTGDEGAPVPGYLPRLLQDRDSVLYFRYSPAEKKESLVLARVDDLGTGTALVDLFPSPPPVPRLGLGDRTAPIHLRGQRFAFSDRWGRAWEIDLDSGDIRDLEISGCDPLGYLESTNSLLCRHREDGHLLEIDKAVGEVNDHGIRVGSGALVLSQPEWLLFSELADRVLPERPDLFAYDLRTRERKRVLKGVDLRSGEIVPCDAFHPAIQERFRD